MSRLLREASGVGISSRAERLIAREALREQQRRTSPEECNRCGLRCGKRVSTGERCEGSRRSSSDGRATTRVGSRAACSATKQLLGERVDSGRVVRDALRAIAAGTVASLREVDEVVMHASPLSPMERALVEALAERCTVRVVVSTQSASAEEARRRIVMRCAKAAALALSRRLGSDLDGPRRGVASRARVGAGGVGGRGGDARARSTRGRAARTRSHRGGDRAGRRRRGGGRRGATPSASFARCVRMTCRSSRRSRAALDSGAGARRAAARASRRRARPRRSIRGPAGDRATS